MEATGSVKPLGWDDTLEVPLRNQDWYEKRGYEPFSATLYRASCLRSDVVVDIGAHVGFYALSGKRANPASRVIAVELSPTNSAVLQRNVDSSGLDIEVINAAFGDRSGHVTALLTEASDNSSLTGHPDSPTAEVVEVRAIRGDELHIARGSRVTVKIDVEGHELPALRGIEGVLDSARDATLFVEFNPRCLHAAQNSPEELLDWLLERGYRIFSLDEVEHTWREIRDAVGWQLVISPESYANLYCSKRDGVVSVAMVMHSGDIGGAERAQVELAEGLIGQGLLVHTVIPGPDRGLRARVLEVGSSVTEVPAMSWWMVQPDEQPESNPAWAGDLVSADVVNALALVDPDVIVTQTGVIPQGALAAAILNKPHVWFLHEFGDADHGLQLPLDPREFGSVVASLSNAVVTNSAAVRDYFFTDSNASVAVIRITPRLDFAPVAAPPPRPWTLGVVGSLNPGKGHEDALAAVAHLKRLGVMVPLVFAGTGHEDERDRLLGVAEALGIADLLHMPGTVHDQHALYGMFDAVAVTSRSEAFGRVPFEAIAAGLPVIYSASGGLVEYMRPGITGLPYQPGDPLDLANAMNRLREEEGLASALVNAAADELLNASIRAEQLGDFMRQLEAAHQPREPDVLRRMVTWSAVSAFASAVRAARAESALSALSTDHAVLETMHRDLAAGHAALASQYHDLVLGNLGLAAAHDELRTQYDSLFQGHNGLAVAHERLMQDIAEKDREAAVLGAELARLRAVEADLNRVTGSRTWRLSAPLRVALDVLKRRR